MTTSVEDELFDSDNVAKYELAGRIARDALTAVLAALEAGAKIADLCALGDRVVEQVCRAVF